VRAVERRLDHFKPQELANTAWAFATADRSDALLFVLLVRVVERRLGEFKPQDFANTAWAFATAAWLNAPLCMGIVTQVPLVLSGFQEDTLWITLTLWSSLQHERLMIALSLLEVLKSALYDSSKGYFGPCFMECEQRGLSNLLC